MLTQVAWLSYSNAVLNILHCFTTPQEVTWTIVHCYRFPQTIYCLKDGKVIEKQWCKAATSSDVKHMVLVWPFYALNWMYAYNLSPECNYWLITHDAHNLLIICLKNYRLSIIISVRRQMWVTKTQSGLKHKISTEVNCCDGVSVQHRETCLCPAVSVYFWVFNDNIKP